MVMRQYLLPILVIALSSCNRQGQGIGNADEQVVRELSHRRIVMLADFGHEYPLPYYTLSSVLSTWLRMLENGETEENHLTLILEQDSSMANLLKQYLKTGDLNPWLDFILPSTSLERLEFYAGLRRLTLQIDSLNALWPVSRRITFDVFGAEEMNVFDPRVIDSLERSTAQYFVVRRDSISASRIAKYLEEHPGQKALVFYGDAHLMKNFVRKPFAEALPPEQQGGRFMGYYLKKEFGEDQAFTINQLERERSPVEENKFNSDVFFLAKDVPWKNSIPARDEADPTNFDAFIVRTEKRIPGHPLSHVFSNRLISACIKRMEFLEPHVSGGLDPLVPHLTGEFAQRYYNEAASDLAFLCDTAFPSASGWKSWCATHRAATLDILLSDSFRNSMVGKYSHRQNSMRDFQNLIDLGFDPTRAPSRNMTPEDWNEFFDKMWPQVVALNSIGMVWVGESEEQAAAKRYLAQVGGRSNDPAGYLKWWRRKFFDAAY